MIFSLRQIEKGREPRHLHVAFVYLSKSFDVVNRKRLEGLYIA